MIRARPVHALAALLLLGLALLPLTAAHLPGGGPSVDVGIQAPPTPVWEAASQVGAAFGGVLPLLVRRTARRRERAPRRVVRGAQAPRPGLRQRAQRWYGRRLLEGG